MRHEQVNLSSEDEMKKAIATQLSHEMVVVDWRDTGQPLLISWRDTGKAVTDREWEYAMFLLEETLDSIGDLMSGDHPRYKYSAYVYAGVPELRQPFRATWQQRCIAWFRTMELYPEKL